MDVMQSPMRFEPMSYAEKFGHGGRMDHKWMTLQQTPRIPRAMMHQPLSCAFPQILKHDKVSYRVAPRPADLASGVRYRGTVFRRSCSGVLVPSATLLGQCCRDRRVVVGATCRVLLLWFR